MSEAFSVLFDYSNPVKVHVRALEEFFHFVRVDERGSVAFIERVDLEALGRFVLGVVEIALKCLDEIIMTADILELQCLYQESATLLFNKAKVLFQIFAILIGTCPR